MPVDGLHAGIERMRRAGEPEHAIVTFERSYERLRAGDRGLLPECEIEPLERIPEVGVGSGNGESDPAGLDRVALVRLNGGLGTSMVTGGRKGLLEVKAGLSFVELAARQIEALRQRTSCELPLMLMNSAATGPATMAALAQRPGSAGQGPGEFRQSLLPRLRADDLRPIDWPGDPTLEWAPAGHGAVFASLAGSGRLRALLDAGYRHLCICSIDNVAAVVDPRIVSTMARESIPFLMEVADRTDADRKGGHLTRTHDGALVLRELAQTPAEDRAAFHDVERHRYFNTNTIWVDLRALDAMLVSRHGVVDLPMIANHKPVDPCDPTSPEVIQIESAMGAAISVFPDAAARRVDRGGFDPVRTIAELLAVRSDAYVLTDELRVVLADERGGRKPIVDLDPAYFTGPRQLAARFPAGPPSLVACDELVVRGDVSFGRDVVVRGTARIEHEGPGQRHIPDGAVLGDDS